MKARLVCSGYSAWAYRGRADHCRTLSSLINWPQMIRHLNLWSSGNYPSYLPLVPSLKAPTNSNNGVSSESSSYNPPDHHPGHVFSEWIIERRSPPFDSMWGHLDDSRLLRELTLSTGLLPRQVRSPQLQKCIIRMFRRNRQTQLPDCRQDK